MRTIRAECTDRLPASDEQHLWRVLIEYAEHHNTSRPHRALQLRDPADDPDVIPLPAQRMQHDEVLAGLINEYHRAAA